MPRWSLLVVLAVAACGGDGECPLIGCVSQLTVQLPAGAASARACVEEVCSSDVVDGVVQVPLGRRAEGSTVSLSVEVTDAAGATTTVTGDAAVQRSRPNGPGCPPVCVVGTVRVDPTTGSLMTVEEDAAS